MNSCNTVNIHFAGLAIAKFIGKTKIAKIAKLVLTKFVHIEVYDLAHIMCFS